MERIHFILTQDLSSPSGQGRYLPWAKELARLGYKVRISATHSNYKTLKTKFIYFDGVEIEYVGQMHVLKKGAIKSYFPLLKLIIIVIYSSIALSIASLKFPADIVIIGKPHPMNGLAGIIGTWRWKSVFVLDIDDDEEYSGNFRYRWQKKLIGWLQKKLAFHANLVTTNTFYMKEKLKKFGIPPAKIYYLPNGIELHKPQLPSREKVNQLREELGLDKKKVILYVGSISIINHPLPLLIQAFEKIQFLNPETVLIIVGGGEDFEMVKALIHKKNLDRDIRLLGKVPPEDVPKYYAIADVSVDPVYDNEAARGRCPIKLFESLKYGTPFVTGDVGDRRLLAGIPPAYKICTPGDPESLADCINEILKNDNLSSFLVNEGKRRVKEYEWRYIVQKFCEEALPTYKKIS